MREDGDREKENEIGTKETEGQKEMQNDPSPTDK